MRGIMAEWDYEGTRRLCRHGIAGSPLEIPFTAVMGLTYFYNGVSRASWTAMDVSKGIVYIIETRIY